VNRRKGAGINEWQASRWGIPGHWHPPKPSNGRAGAVVREDDFFAVRRPGKATLETLGGRDFTRLADGTQPGIQCHDEQFTGRFPDERKG
jgi:hypothetical protein